MIGISPFVMSPNEKAALKRQLASHQGAISFTVEPELAAYVAALGMQQEVGTRNDELARFVFDASSGLPIPRKRLRAELVRYGRTVGVRIFAEGEPPLDIRFPNLRTLTHPAGKESELLIFPAAVARFLQSQGVEPVIVIPWALNTVFGGFHPADGFYQTNMWELKNVDAIRYARLVEKRQLAFLGTHDFVAHIAGTQGEAWDALTKVATRVRERLEGYVADVSHPNLSALILPYVAGIMLDDLAQPPCYGAESRLTVLNAVLDAIDKETLPPAAPLQLLKFPDGYAPLLEMARFGELPDIHRQTKPRVRELVSEIAATSVFWQ